MGVQTSFFSETDIENYRRDGFIAVSQMYGPDEICDLKEWINAFSNREPIFGEQMVYLEDSLTEEGTRVLSRIEKFADYHQGLHDLVYGERIIGRITELLGECPLLFKEKINFKLPGSGGFEPHQDIQPGWDDYASFFISDLITVDPSTLDNGCLELASGHHKKGLLGEKRKPLTPKQLEGVEFVRFPTEPGDVVFFDCFVPHQSKPNLTDSPRRNLYLTFNRSSEGDHREQYYADKRANYPPDNERDPEKNYKFRV
ncbi:MAG: phytanoyl-CoA dioxygenase family protein [Planctomycetota bacterium]|nr:phytanoyl-CoA dioxygenase family protein [Planctomycetota bacterium]MDA1138074.1 phytanoyl-CoA dioxygenase family protein [Planctomycetota bacterium]